MARHGERRDQDEQSRHGREQEREVNNQLRVKQGGEAVATGASQASKGEHIMREFLKITAGGLMVVLAVTPALAQTSTQPNQQQQAPRNQGDVNRPSTSGSDTSKASPTPQQNSNTQDSQSKGTMREAPPTTSSMSRDNATDSTGMTGKKAGKASVRQVQEALKAQGHDPGPVDGVMGPQTQEALRDYQHSQNLTETGRLDPQTAGKLGVGGSMNQRQGR